MADSPFVPKWHGHTSTALTQREWDVVKCVCIGISNKEVAVKLGISKETVTRHLGNIFGKLGISSRSALIVWYAQTHQRSEFAVNKLKKLRKQVAQILAVIDAALSVAESEEDDATEGMCGTTRK